MKNILAVGIEKCFGCSVCSVVCPKQCISMKSDSEGFLFPFIDEKKCIHCGICVKQCPLESEITGAIPFQAFAAVSKRIKETSRSSSGGAFYEIADYFIRNMAGYVCGCVMNDNYLIHHILTNNISDLVRMQGSKYVQSNIAEILPHVKKIINGGIPVLFSGTPCQVEAVRSFIGESKLLFTVDIVCHGVTSPSMFKLYMKKTYPDSSLESFRYKNPFETSTYAFTFKNGKRIHGQLDPFFNSFLRGRSFRESCYSCKYACPERGGDITLGDCANFRAYTSLAGKPISTVLINSEKGNQMWQGIEEKMLFVEADFNREKEMNHQLNSPSQRMPERSTFYSDLINMSGIDFYEKYAEHWSIKTKIKRFLIMHIPYSIRLKFRHVH